MTIEELKKERAIIRGLAVMNDDNLANEVIETNNIQNVLMLTLDLIDSEIARQSVTDEDVKRAIEWAEQEREYNFRYMKFGDADSASLAITALQQMQKEPISIAKPPILKYVCTYLCPRDVPDGDDEYGHEPHCANCGKRFERFPRIKFCSECGQKQNWEEIEKQISEES